MTQKGVDFSLVGICAVSDLLATRHSPPKKCVVGRAKLERTTMVVELRRNNETKSTEFATPFVTRVLNIRDATKGCRL